MKRYDVEQGSQEWYRLRLGIPTASEFSSIMTPTGKLSSQADGYMHRLLAEWLLGAPLETVETQWMERGHELEPQAVRAYEFEADLATETVGFLTTDDGLIGCSPDRLIVGAPGLLEIKCPAPHTHVGYMVTRTVDKAYYPQLQGQLYVSEREWVDIQSYYPGLPTVVIRVLRDDAFIGCLEIALARFVERMLAARANLQVEFGPPRWTQEPEPGPASAGPLGISDADVDLLVAAKFGKGAE